MAASVEVLMATYNSARFLPQMLDSLASQSFGDFRLTVSDDCSRDDTIAIVEAAAPRFRNPIRILRRDRPSGGAMQNFSSMLPLAEGDHVLFADHDDVWLPDKIARSTERMAALEAAAGAATPLLVHADLKVVDGDLNPVADSFWRFKAIRPGYGVSLNTALMHASVTGCTMIVNRALLRRTGSVPPEAVMHDWWLNLVAAAFGRVDYIDAPLALYRVHGSNASRPTRYDVVDIVARSGKIWRLRQRVHQRIAQGAALHQRYGDALPPDARALLAAFSAIPQRGFLGRRAALLRGRFLTPGVARNVANLLFV